MVIITGFVFIVLMYLGNSRDWEENPFITSIEEESLLNSGFPFPTVTVCQDPNSAPDRWALIEDISDNVKFQCYHSSHKMCNETLLDATHKHQGVRALKSKMLQYALDNLKDEEIYDSLPNNRDCIVNLMGLSESETFEKLRDSIGRASNPEEIFCENGKDEKWTFDSEDFCPPDAMNETSECIANLTRAKTSWSKANMILPLSITFGSLFESYASKALGFSFDSSLFGRWSACSKLGEAEEMMHQYLESITAGLGLEGNVSLFDLPTSLAPQVGKFWYLCSHMFM